ncbi:hypothetical protein GCM10009547_31920 [Sporichthya brevicatena]|uniref:histidine kinase n=1 Tax=Sporichthya brevicatena TaxID=171442 RepID=A0ABN1H199_9ACTN
MPDDEPSSAGAGLPRTRRWAALGTAAAVLPAMTVVMVGVRENLDLESVLLLYVLAVVLISLLGGVLPAVVAAAAALLLATHWFTEPYGDWDVTHRLDAIALVTFGLVAVGVSVTVELAARARVAAARERVEADLLSRVTSGPVRETSLADVLTQVRDAFGMTSVALLADASTGSPRTVGRVGPPLTEAPVISADAGDGLRLVAVGPEHLAADRRLFGRLAGAAARAWDAQRLAEAAAQEAARAADLAEVDRLRSALLAAVGHDLRTPLAGIKAAVSSLRAPDVAFAEADRAELLAQIENSADRLDELVANLLAMSRLQAGVLSVQIAPVALDEVVARVLLEGSRDTPVEVDVPDDLPHARTDGGLLERVVANVVDNACRFAPAGTVVRIVGRATADGRALRLAVTDRGPGVPPEQWEEMFTPFQRLDDRSGPGVGLGLAIARGFTTAVGGTLTPSATEGGGLTMTLTLPLEPDSAGRT